MTCRDPFPAKPFWDSMKVPQMPCDAPIACATHTFSSPHKSAAPMSRFSPWENPVPPWDHCCAVNNRLCSASQEKGGFCSRFIDSTKPPEIIPMEEFCIHEAEALIF